MTLAFKYQVILSEPTTKKTATQGFASCTWWWLHPKASGHELTEQIELCTLKCVCTFPTTHRQAGKHKHAHLVGPESVAHCKQSRRAQKRQPQHKLAGKLLMTDGLSEAHAITLPCLSSLTWLSFRPRAMQYSVAALSRGAMWGLSLQGDGQGSAQLCVEIAYADLRVDAAVCSIITRAGYSMVPIAKDTNSEHKVAIIQQAQMAQKCANELGRPQSMKVDLCSIEKLLNL
eukprot:452636-Pelagomonas_calceolata.AAC.3